MVWPISLSVALKEWAIVCRALESGRQIVLLRKGGIYEAGGEFELEHRQFLLFPTYLHQDPAMIKPADQAGFEARTAEPAQVTIRAAGMVSDIVPVQSRRQVDAIAAEHIWSPPLIDMRFNYKPHNPLYVLLVRTYRLREPLKLDNAPAYAGCKSWVPLERDVSMEQAAAVLDDRTFADRRRAILETMKP